MSDFDDEDGSGGCCCSLNHWFSRTALKKGNFDVSWLGYEGTVCVVCVVVGKA